MILASAQLAALIYTAYRLVSFKRDGLRYKFHVSLLASIWGGAALALAVAMLLQWPDAVEQTTALTAMAAGASAAATAWCGGNVADLWRKLARSAGHVFQ